VSAAELRSPVFVLGAPQLTASLARAAGVLHARTPFLDPLLTERGAERLTADDAAELADAARAALAEAVIDREGRPLEDADGSLVPVAGGPLVASSVGFLAAAFADARFVLVAGGPEASDADVDGLARERLIATDFDALLADPRTELRRLCEVLDIRYDQALLAPLEEAARVRAGRVPTEPAESPLRSVFTASFEKRMAYFGSSLLISTYQTGKLIAARTRGEGLNTHFRNFAKPMGIAVGADGFCLGTRTEIWDMRDMPEVAPKVEPPGTHDACYLPRNRHITGDISIHELAFADGQLWFVATAFSCLATLDVDHSFVPRWTPPFITALATGDRCHLNGLAVVEDEVRYVTALGQTDEPGSWRPGKASGGVILDVPSSEIVVSGLSMPHSPRWHDGRLWVLESGKGELCVVDLETGRSETVVELPGFTRGLVFAGKTAFVGLSQIRESSTFGDLPLVERLEERLCGVWMVDVERGAVEGFLRFDDLVQEVFDVAILPGKRYPEIAEPESSAVATSFQLP
jgi:uncharacterized protein (TIGR03032 family)